MGEAIIEKNSGDLFYYKGTTPGQRGIGFLIKKELKPAVKEIIGVSERIAVLKLQMRNLTTTIIQTYAPTENSSEEDIENFYNYLEASLNQHRSQRNLIIGDLNSKVGKRSHAEEEAVGPHGYGSRNKRGDKVVQFAQEHRLKIANSFFRKPQHMKWTWHSPDGKTKNEIDYILCDRLQDIKDIQVESNLKFSTDHRMVKASITTKRETRYRRRPNCRQVERLDGAELSRQIQEKITKTNFITKSEVQELYNTVEECIKQATEA